MGAADKPLYDVAAEYTGNYRGPHYAPAMVSNIQHAIPFGDRVACVDLRKSMVVVALIAVALASSAIILVGFHANPPPFDWSAAVDTGTAVGTTMLALSTVWLALEARNEREHTRRLVAIQERDEARKDEAWISVRSAFIVYKPGSSGPNGAIVEVELVNAGHGPAINIAASLEVWGSRQPGSGRSVIGVKTVPLLMPMTTERIRILPTPDASFNFSSDMVSVTCINVQYRDKLTKTGGFKEADPFWELTPAVLRGGNVQTSEIVAR